ncbi:cytochrome oxidase assembly protein Sco [Rhizobium pusense]|jgi:protein SCO1/2|uniref:SCO family protein n=2 Tax=Agrobacterium TaxID=357 RepID=A0A1L9CSD5_9HYPH|nr:MULTISPECIES: cytochrome oxidase assembly protein Sco [Rhizobium/Agrobacterium group]AMD59635.1 cytochrome c oxidase assembly protein [Agrobacterium tumefaciens]ANV23329.1 cytochrome c oxidase assembly protein [Rhizobium sp. S41]KGE83914.1 copper chaperone [Rhizobium sp. H41]MBB2907505.1 protein SCO1/2 [Rhizobium sp. RAS22]MDP9733710.1 protein SCO1/2 [Rhizobium sp. SORGH_AS_0285]MDP9754461.1 protein SCO1/2 [Rhizobium sp. SORGH_AS_0260]PZU75047.1 MAG: SCO family protein [Rhizobium sp.]HCJ
MRNIRIVLWAVVLVLAGVVSWLTIEMTKTREQMVETAYGVPFELTAQTGQPITEKAFQGKPTALFFGFTHCPEVCPTTLFELNGWMEKVDPAGDKLQAYFVSVDPERDTPEIMQQYVSNVSKRITGITGPADKIAETLKGYRIYAKKVPVDEKDPNGDYTMDHTASVILLDANGRFAGTIAYGENPDVAEQKLQNLLKGAKV